MKGSVFVGFYSLILIALFIVCCYLMTIVNPKPLPEDARRLGAGAVDSIYPRNSLPPNDNPNYGLEKIPEGIDAAEFRKTTVTKYDITTEPTYYARGQKVVPPIWPTEYRNEIERSDFKVVNESNTKSSYEMSSSIKGHRRSVNEDTNGEQKNNSGRILIKIIDASGRMKVETKFLSRENNKISKQRNASNKLNGTINSIANSSQSNYSNVTNGEDNVIKINANDVIVLTIFDDSRVVLDESLKSGTETTEAKKNISMDDAHARFYLNETSNNGPNKVDLRKAGDDLTGELMKK